MTSLANRRSAILLFSLPDCLHSHRTRLVIKEKEISAELHEIDLNNISEEIKFLTSIFHLTFKLTLQASGALEVHFS